MILGCPWWLEVRQSEAAEVIDKFILFMVKWTTRDVIVCLW